MSNTTGQTSDRKWQLRAVADGYFSGLANGDVSAVAYDENVRLRTPLAAGGSETPLQGRAAVLNFFAGIYAALEDVKVIDYFFNDELTTICVRADVMLKTGKVLRVADVFRISADGKVIEQENHYDPRPATE
ncbi:MAG: nuclear transport factor 2 family protein [Bryobacteraceae bacterium]|nr:nuclear transport factor 2 family protein [Bryobacteraceae bacterium]